jgi:hypothetical protein
MKCVVCGAGIGEGKALYANAWEEAQKRFPCCSSACGSAFSPDKHWIPGQLPAPADPVVQERLLAVCKQRLVTGDRPTVVLHEMLNAGIDSAALRALFLNTFVSAAKSQKVAREESREMNLLGTIFGFITGHFHFHVANPSNKADPQLVDTALADLDRWDSWKSGAAG